MPAVEQQAAPGPAAEPFSGRSVVAAGGADVGIAREHRRLRRLWALAAVLGVPTGYLWWRLAERRPFNVFAVPSVDWVMITPILFFIALVALMVGYYAVSGRSPHVLYRPEQIDVVLADVVGIDSVREEVIRSLNLFLAHKTFAAETGGRPRRGLLFEGPPGTGKTYTAKAVAAEAGVPFLFATATSFQSSFYGATARKIRAYFKQLRAVAQREGGAIGFIDEFDAIAGRRGGMEFAALPKEPAGCQGMSTMPSTYRLPALNRSEFGTSDLTGPVVNELLVQMQSFDQPTGAQKLIGTVADRVNLFLPPHRQLPKPAITPANIMLIASTNRADGLDPALLRPGRFDRKLAFELPDRVGRRALIDHFLARKSHTIDLEPGEQRDILAGLTQGYSPAMIEGLFDEALVNAVARHDTAMNWADVEQARLTEEVGLGQPVGYTAHEKRLIATHEAGHATLAWLVAPERRLEVLSIIKRKDALGMLAHGDKDDVFTRSRSEMLALIQIAMAGQCAEDLFFGDVSTGPGGDLLYATNVAAQMVGACGMTGSLVSYAAIQTSAFNDYNLVGRVLADARGRDAVEALLQEQRAVASRLVAKHRHLVEALRDALLDRHELVGPEITGILLAADAAPAANARPAVVDLRDRADTLPR
ncbi:MAG: AAA family ATPase [Pseudonocardiales bacterium]